MMPEAIEDRVLYRDGLMIGLNKPAGVAVHRAPKGGPSLEATFGLPHPPALAHRLDRETSGSLIRMVSLIRMDNFHTWRWTHTCAQLEPNALRETELSRVRGHWKGGRPPDFGSWQRGFDTQGVAK
jgi:hypothetical protein